MSRNLNRPFFPIPPREYNFEYFQEIIRSFSTYVDQQQNPGEGRNTQLVLTNLQEHDQGLEVGGLFQQEGFVKICRANVPHLAGVLSTTATGTVTVTIS